jgi:hypothetical protein
MQDYTLETTMIWEECKLQSFVKRHLEQHTTGVLFWAGRYLQKNLKANYTPSMSQKLLSSHDGSEIKTGFRIFDDKQACKMPLVVATTFHLRFRELVSRFLLTVFQRRIE